MKTQIKIEEVSGKTVDKIVIDERYAALAFSDGTFVVLRAHSWGDGDAEIEEIEWRDCSLSDNAKVVLGLVSKEEIDAKRQREEESRKAFALARRKAEYEKLRLEFEGK